MLILQSLFTVQNPCTQLVKIDHMMLLYLTSANSNSALLTIMHKNRAVLTMASADRFAEIVKEQISQIINEAIPMRTKRQTNWSNAIFKGKLKLNSLIFVCIFLQSAI